MSQKYNKRKIDVGENAVTTILLHLSFDDRIHYVKIGSGRLMIPFVIETQIIKLFIKIKYDLRSQLASLL